MSKPKGYCPMCHKPKSSGSASFCQACWDKYRERSRAERAAAREERRARFLARRRRDGPQ